MRILLVEDEAPLRETLAARLKREGYAVDAAQDGEEGLYMGKEVPFDVAIIDLGDTMARLPAKGVAWTAKTRVSDAVKVGDIVLVRILRREEASERKVVEVSLEQEPEAESAFLAMDTRTGAVRAMVGGFDFERSKFNRAVQAHRQTGSIFKAIVYSAAVESLGWTP